jgi:rhodanese-related sulfurtransferase
VLVALTGAAFAFAANELSPRGLALTRNYFPAGAGTSVSASYLAQPRQPDTVGSHDDSGAEIDRRLKEKGLQPIDRVQTEKLFRDPRRSRGLIVFVDARDEDHYRDGHIPGAYQLNPYHPEKELANVLAPCQFAAQVIVYCAGGECEDADSTAILLRDAGVSAQKMFVFGGGYDEWSKYRLPVEQGEHDSGAASASAK